MPKKPHAAAAEQNRVAILAILQQEFKHLTKILELGSGTGQHAAYFAQHLPHLTWQASDKQEMLNGISMWIDNENCPNTLSPIELDVSQQWPQQTYDGAFAANVAHIMHWNEIEAMFSGLDQVLEDNGVFCLYGPFNINGNYTSESNARFDQWLKDRDPNSCIRNKQDLDQLALKNNFKPSNDWPMPANNKILSWRR